MRKTKSLRMFAICAVLIGMFLIAGPASTLQAAGVTKWRCQVFWPSSSSSFQGSAITLANKIKERTNGRLIIEMFPGGSLIPSKEIFSAVKRGMIPMGAINSGYALAHVPVLAVANGLPMAFNHPWEAIHFHRWMGFEAIIQAEVAKHGMYWSTDKANATELATKEKITSADDFKGLKLRSSGLWQNYLKELGAAASYIPASEIYAALATGVVGGLHYGAAQGQSSMKLYELNKFHLKPALGVSGNDGWLINEKAMSRLPKDVQDIVKATLAEHFFMRTNQYTFLEAKTLSNAVKTQGVEVVTLAPAEQAKMQKAAVKIWDDVAAKGPVCAKAVQMIKDFNKMLGRDID